MKTVNIHEAKTHLSRLVNEEFIIAKAGNPSRASPPLSREKEHANSAS